MTKHEMLKELEMSNEEKLINTIDDTITKTCKWIQNVLSKEESQINPTETIKALTELVSARALITDVLKKPITQ